MTHNEMRQWLLTGLSWGFTKRSEIAFSDCAGQCLTIQAHLGQAIKTR